MMILPSLARHAEATEGSGDSSHDMDLAATNSVADEDIVDKHTNAAPLEATHQNIQKNESQEIPDTTESQAPHGANTHLVPSHHLSTLSHPQVHYIPSVSMPTISAGGNGQPTHSNTPPTPTTPVTFIPEVIKGTYGELHVDVNGQYTFVLNPNSPQYILLNQHQQGTDHFALHLSNGASIVVQIPVTGKQDLPSISGDLAGIVTEDHNVDSQGLLHANGKIDVIDPDQNESSVTPEVISGKYGSLTIDADGHWQYQVDNSLSNVQALTRATSLHESFTIHTKDGTPQTIDMTIGGNDDNAVITGVDTGSVIEDLTTQVQGQLSVTDPDLGEDHFQASQVNGHLGTLTIDKDGAWTYDLDNTNPKVQALSKGATATDTVTVHSADGTPHQITVTVNGTNDKAVISGTSSGAVKEESQLQTSGTLTITDVDTGEAHFSNTDVAGALGTLHLKDNGAWTYDLDNTNPTVQALGKGATATDTITVHSADGTPHQITVTVNGTNDKAVIGGTNSGAVTEESQLQTSGTLTITDVDTGEAHFSNTDVTGALGTLHLKDNGAWTYDLDNTNPKVQALGKGATATDTVTVHSADGTPHQVTVTINGTNDRPTISGTSSGAVIEQGLNTAGNPDATGSLIATDIDKSDTITWAINQPQGQWGTLSIDQNGHWHYQLDNLAGGAADKLASGEHQSEQFWITATDSAGATVPHKIVIDVQGSNDKPIVSAWTQLPAGKEDQPVTIKASDLLTHANDVDSSDVLHVTNLQATHGHLVDNKDGTYTFTPDKDFNGEIRLTYDVVDGHGGSVSTQAKFDLTATPDNAIITDAQTNADLRGVTEDRGYIDTHYQLHYDGKLDIQDPDAGEAQFDPNIGPQTYQGIGYDTKLGGHILLMRDGHYIYTLDNRNIQNLAQGEVKHDSAVIRSADGTTHTIELTVHGTNDAPTINAQSHSVTEGGSVLNGQMVGQDIDTGATLTYSAPQIDGLVVNPDGSYSFNPAHSSYQSLASGVTKTLTVPVTVTDEHNASSTQNLSITITGVNNSAVIGGVDTGNVTEGNAGQDMSPDYAQPGMAHLVRSTIDASGKLTIADTDTGEAEFDTHGLGFNYAGQYGDLLLRKDGTWFYHADTGQIRSTGGLTSTRGTTIDQLGENQTLTDTITVFSKDGTSHDIVITIHGSNDRPYCASEVQLNSGKEDLAQTITATELLTNTVDVDANDAGKLTIANLHADHGSIQDNHDGTYTFTPVKDYNGQVHFTYDVKDAHGGTTHTGANTTLAATPDKAIISEVTTGRVIEDGPHATHNNGTTTELANGQLQVIDLDSGEDKFQYSQFGETRIHDPFGGMLRIDSAGNWGYSVDNAALQHLAQGQVETVTYRVHSFDGTAYDLNIDVVGTNDAPTVTKVALSNGTEDINYQMQASQFGFTDVDTGDTLHSIAITDLPTAAQGKFVLDGHDITAGQRIIASDITKLQFVPAPNFNGDVQFKFTVNDGHASSAETTNTLHIDAVSDAAQISGQLTTEDRSHVTEDVRVSGHMLSSDSMTLHVHDPDSGQNFFIPTGATGTTNGQSNGTWVDGDNNVGQFILHASGQWLFRADNNNPQIDQLGAGQKIQDTITVQSADGTTQQLTAVIHGTNDAPIVSTQVQLATGQEDSVQVLSSTTLLANSSDVDLNDIGKLFIDNLHADHGTIVDNKDGTFTFTPDHNYNGQVHFTYDVNDAHGGTTHTGANTTLAAVNDAATITGVDSGSVTEDQNVHSSVQGNYSYKLEAKGHLTAVDPDAGESGFDYHTLIGAPTHPNWAPYRSALGGELEIDQQGRWHYYIDNRKSEVQSLGAGETLTDTVTIQSKDGTPHMITLTINGTNDDPVLSVTQTTPTTGTLTETDVDVKDTHTFSVVNSTGQFGSLSVDPDSGAYVYTANGSVAGMSYNATTHTYHGADVFEVKVSDNHGGESSKFITFDANGHVSVVPGQSPTISTSVPSNPLVTTTQPSLPAGTNTPPNNAVTVDLATSSDTGTSDTDNLTKDSTPTVTGHTDIPYSQVTIYDGSTPIGHALSDGSGQYSVAVSSLSNGAHNLSAKALAPSSVLPSTSSILPLHVDTVVAPLQVSLTHDTGSNSSDLITSDGSLTITGQETGATVEYSTDNGHTWTSSFTPQQGSNTVSVRQTDAAGNVSTPTSLTFTYDDQTATPSIDLKASTDSGVSTTDDLTNIHTPIITGMAEANSAISITDETGKVIATGTANSSGVYQLTTSDIAEGKHTLTVSSTDVAGNQSSASLPVEVDYTAPTISKVNLKTETTHQPTFSGTVSLDTTSVDIVIKSGSTIIETLHATLDGKGGYTVDATNLPDQSYTAYIQATDKAGNSTASGYAGTFDRFIVDTHASAPTISFESTGLDNIYNAAEVASGAASTITSTIHLPSDAHPKDTLTINGHSHHITDAEFLAKSVNIEVAPGASITASITDQNGNTSTVTNAIAPSADVTVAPLQVSLTHDTGSNSSDLITSDGSLTITGQETGATVEYSTDNGHTWTPSFTPQQGSNTVSVRQTDAAGNISPDTSVTFTLDNTIAAPAVSLRNDTGRHSVNTPDLITKDSQLTIQTEAGAKVEYSNDGGHTWTAVFNPVEGVNDLQVRQTDIAGNVSPVTHFSFTLDTTPGTITVNPISQDNALNAAENNQPLVITGTTSNIAPGDVVYVVIGNKHFYDATVKTDGTWSLTLGTSIHQNIMATDRDYSIQVGTVDTAGNSTPRISTHLLIDTQSPIPHIAVDSVTQDNVLNALESGQTIAITGTVTGDYQAGDIVSLKINGATISSLTGSVDSSGHFSIPVAGNVLEHANIHTSYANGQSGSIHSIEATIITTDAVGNVGSATTGSQVFSVDTHVSLPTITFENPGPDGLYSKAEIAHGHPNTVTATITPPGDAKVGEHLVVNGQDHVLDAHSLQHGLQIEVNPGSQVQVTMTDEHGNTAGSQGVAASAIPEPIVVKPPSGSHQVSGTLGVPPLVPSQTPVPSAQNGWRIHLPNGQYVTSHHGQYGTLTIDPQTGHLHYQEQAQVHTGPHGSASGIGQHEDKFEIALQGTNQDEVVAHVNVQILSHGPGHSGKLTIGTEVVDMTITPIVHASHPAPPPPPPVQHDEPEIASHEDFTFTVSEDTSLDLSQHAHQEPDQKTDHQGAAAYLDALGIQPNASPTTGHDQPADMDIVLAQVDEQHAVDYDQTHLDMSDALEHHDAANNHNQDDEHHHHHDVDGLPDIDPNN
ncbi:VCBS domain-containing protein [Vibrio chagasii]